MAEFGYHTIGATGFDDPGGNVIWAKSVAGGTAPATPASSGTLNFIAFNGKVFAGTPTVAAAIYSDNAGAPGNLLAQSAGTVTVGAQAWYNVTMPAQAIVAGTQYWLALRVTNNATGDDINVAFDTSGGNELFFIAGASFPGTGAGSSGAAERWSIYADYTPGLGIKSPASQITLNPGGIPQAPNSGVLGKSPSYGATRWQTWESYPWGPFVAPAAQVPQPWFIQYQPTTPRTEAEQLPVLQTSQQILFGRTTPTQSRAPWYLWQPPVRTPAPDELPPKTTDYFVLLYGRPQIVLVTQAYFVGSQFVVPDADGLPPLPPPNLNAFRFPATAAAQVGQPWYLWPQYQRQDEQFTRAPQRDGDLHLYRQSFQTVGQPLAMFARVSLPRVELESFAPPPASTQLFFGRAAVIAIPGQPWFMWKGYAPQFDTEIFRQPEIPTLLLVYGRPQVTPVAPTGLHQVNLSVSFGIGLNWMGTRQ